MAADAPAGGPAFACGRPEKPAGDPFERVPVGFPGPDASPRAVPVAGATSGGASEGLITPPDVNRVGIPAFDRKTSPGGQGTSPGSARALRRTSPRGKSTPEPRGVAGRPSPPRVKRQFGESVLSREARKYIRSFFSRKAPRSGAARRALRTRGARERTRGGPSPARSRRNHELERDMQVFSARRLPQRRVVSVQPRDVRPEIDGVHVLPRGELRVRG